MWEEVFHSRSGGDQIFQVCGFFHLGEESWLEDETKVGESGWRVKRTPVHRHSEKVGTRKVGWDTEQKLSLAKEFEKWLLLTYTICRLKKKLPNTTQPQPIDTQEQRNTRLNKNSNINKHKTKSSGLDYRCLCPSLPGPQVSLLVSARGFRGNADIGH